MAREVSFSRRTDWEPRLNRLAAAVAERRRHRAGLLDLTASNPTRVGLDFDEAEVTAVMAAASAGPYEPHPLGLPEARVALAKHLTGEWGRAVDPDDLVLTASTSEAYGQLLKILADPGDEILTLVPGYPLLDQLAEMEAVRLRGVPLEWNRRWCLEPGRLGGGDRLRGLIVVNPGNPTGACLDPEERHLLREFLVGRRIPLIADEVFLDYPLVTSHPAASLAGLTEEVPCMSLGGLSKSAALPHLKLGWILLSGAGRDRVRRALELVADVYLSVSTPVQRALPELLRLLPGRRRAVRQRLQENLRRLREVVAAFPEVELLEPDGGWAVMLRVPRLGGDEEMALRLLAEADVVVHPGYLYDLGEDGFLVLSLLTPTGTLVEGVARLAALVGSRARP